MTGKMIKSGKCISIIYTQFHPEIKLKKLEENGIKKIKSHNLILNTKKARKINKVIKEDRPMWE
jgi:hypothetical protein